MKKKCTAVILALLMALSMGSTVQAAGNGNGNNSEHTKVLAQAPYGGTRVVSYDQGVRYDGLPVNAERSNPNAVLTYETDKVESSFYSLGFSMGVDGWVIIEFKNPVQNGDGNDLRIIEDTWGLPYPRESAAVYVSMNGRSWRYLGEADNQKPIDKIHTMSEFDLEKVNMKEARYVMVKDTSIKSDFDKYSSSQGKTLDGFDLNAVLALHDYTVKTGCCGGCQHGFGWDWFNCGWHYSCFRTFFKICEW